ncbi:thioesterase II family protein [Kitasatospora sp. NPDC006697]|uniref:thioesterase II family protein n=1 Tax=Kitasatospora sp. NPDC006697 TaxID=3364020 RepID=UPI0036B42724
MERSDRIGQVFCLPYAGGSSMIFTKWPVPPRLKRWQALDYPGHLLTMRRPPAADLAELAAGVLAVVLERAEGPYALFGVSMGALVAYEAALAAEAAGRGPELVVLAACRAPDQLAGHPRFSRIPGDEAMLDAFAERYPGIDVGVLAQPQIRDLVLPVLRADLRLFEEYAYGPATGPVRRLAADLLVITGSEDSAASPELAAGWAACTTGSVERLVIEGGDHFFVDKRPAELVELLTDRLWTPDAD